MGGGVVSFNVDSTVNLLNLQPGAEGGLTVDLDVLDIYAAPNQPRSDRLTETAFVVVH